VERWSRTLVTAIGLAAGVGLVMGIVGVSDGLTQAQNKVLSPLSSVGTDIIVTRTVGATTTSGTSSTTTTTAPTGGGFAAGGGGVRGGGFFGSGAGRGGGGVAAINQLNASDQASLLNANSSVLTDLSKLGPAGTQFTYDFFVPGTLITFPEARWPMSPRSRECRQRFPGSRCKRSTRRAPCPTSPPTP
jgi:ABC-type antimicrobial peptide transport system permease subunit